MPLANIGGFSCRRRSWLIPSSRELIWYWSGATFSISERPQNQPSSGIEQNSLNGCREARGFSSLRFCRLMSLSRSSASANRLRCAVRPSISTSSPTIWNVVQSARLLSHTHNSSSAIISASTEASMDGVGVVSHAAKFSRIEPVGVVPALNKPPDAKPCPPIATGIMRLACPGASLDCEALRCLAARRSSVPRSGWLMINSLNRPRVSHVRWKNASWRWRCRRSSRSTPKFSCCTRYVSSLPSPQPSLVNDLPLTSDHRTACAISESASEFSTSSLNLSLAACALARATGET